VAVGYALIGLATVAIGRAAGSAGMHAAVQVVRAASWLLSALLFLLHIVQENRAGRTLPVSSWHTSAAVAMATLLLALVATARQLQAGNTRVAVFVAIAVWPILTGLVSFVAGLVLFGVLRRVSRRPPASSARRN
jgi:hypothetical protein